MFLCFLAYVVAEEIVTVNVVINIDNYVYSLKFLIPFLFVILCDST